MSLPPAHEWGRSVDGRRVQRMREMDSSIVGDAYEIDFLCWAECCGVDDVHTRMRGNGSAKERFSRRSRKRPDPLRDKRAHVVRDRELAPGRNAVAREHGGDLQGVERIAARQLGDAHDERPP